MELSPEHKSRNSYELAKLERSAQANDVLEIYISTYRGRSFSVILPLSVQKCYVVTRAWMGHWPFAPLLDNWTLIPLLIREQYIATTLVKLRATKEPESSPQKIIDAGDAGDTGNTQEAVRKPLMTTGDYYQKSYSCVGQNDIEIVISMGWHKDYLLSSPRFQRHMIVWDQIHGCYVVD